MNEQAVLIEQAGNNFSFSIWKIVRRVEEVAIYYIEIYKQDVKTIEKN